MYLVGFILIEPGMFSLNHSVRNSCVFYRSIHSTDILLSPYFEHDSVPSAKKNTDAERSI